METSAESDFNSLSFKERPALSTVNAISTASSGSVIKGDLNPILLFFGDSIHRAASRNENPLEEEDSNLLLWPEAS